MRWALVPKGLGHNDCVGRSHRGICHPYCRATRGRQFELLGPSARDHHHLGLFNNHRQIEPTTRKNFPKFVALIAVTA